MVLKYEDGTFIEVQNFWVQTACDNESFQIKFETEYGFEIFSFGYYDDEKKMNQESAMLKDMIKINNVVLIDRTNNCVKVGNWKK